MQQESLPYFLRNHSGIVRSVAFSPKDRYIFCSGGADGHVILYNALQKDAITSVRPTNAAAMRGINAVKFSSDGSKILSTTAKKLSVIDATKGAILFTYEHCAYSGKERAPLVVDPSNPDIAICSCSNGRGLITFDLRKQSPAFFALSIHSSMITDVLYMDKSWSFDDKNGQDCVASIDESGICKIRTLDNKEVYDFDVKHRASCMTATPEEYSQPSNDNFDSSIMVGGDFLSQYKPSDDEPTKLLNLKPSSQRLIKRLKYTSNGVFLYSVGSDCLVHRYRRYMKEHKYLGPVFSHKDSILDVDISYHDEFLITASKDKTVGLMCLGTPNSIWTSFSEIR